MAANRSPSRWQPDATNADTVPFELARAARLVDAFTEAFLGPALGSFSRRRYKNAQEREVEDRRDFGSPAPPVSSSIRRNWWVAVRCTGRDRIGWGCDDAKPTVIASCGGGDGKYAPSLP